MMTGVDIILCYTDGASRGNPGPSAYAVILVRNDTVIAENSGYLGEGTNNSAEYQALIHALTLAATYTTGPVTCYSDSELVVRQLTGSYAIRKPHLQIFAEQIDALRDRFSRVEFHTVPREHRCIQRADRLCNRILDEMAAGKTRG
jgi:ribonuclease HI